MIVQMYVLQLFHTSQDPQNDLSDLKPWGHLEGPDIDGLGILHRETPSTGAEHARPRP